MKCVSALFFQVLLYFVQSFVLPITAEAQDTTPPVRSGGTPSGLLAAGTTSVTFQFNTNENASCRFTEIPNRGFFDISDGTSGAGTTSHSFTRSGAHFGLATLRPGQELTYYVKCQDLAGNINPDDYVLSASIAFTPTSNQWYVAPNGTTDAVNGGTQANPWRIDTALNYPAKIGPGDTIWVRGGTYAGRFISKLIGTAQHPIKVRAYTNERVTIDGSVTAQLSAPLASTTSSGSSATLNVQSGFGFNSGYPNYPMQIEMTDPISGLDEAMTLFSVGLTTMVAGRGNCAPFPGGACPSYPVGTPVSPLNASYLYVYGAFTWFMGLELTYNQVTRVIGTGYNPPWPNFNDALNDRCDGCKYINLVIHDGGSNGVASFISGRKTELYGSLIFSNGVDSLADRGHGHGIYTQNSKNGPQKSIIDNIFFWSFFHGNQIYGSSASFLDNFRVEGNVYFAPGKPAHAGGGNFIVGDAGVFSGHIFKNNMSYGGGGIDIGYGGNVSAPECTSPLIEGNYLAGLNPATDNALKVTCLTPTIQSNTIVGKATDFSQASYPSNTYLSTKPAETKIFVRPNQYEVGRATVTVFNWTNLDSTPVDLSGIGLSNGDLFEVRDVQNYYGTPVLTGTYSGSTVVFPLSNTTVTQPKGILAVAPLQHTAKEFNVFVVRKTGSDTTPPAAPSGLTVQ
jgi:hypothetical protein